MTSTHHANPIWFFFSSILLSFVLIFTFLCLSARADNISGSRVFDYTSSPSVFGSSAQMNVLLQSSPKERLNSWDFRKLYESGIKGHKSTVTLASNDLDGLGLFITEYSVGLTWRNKW